MALPKMIGITGKAGSGKDTFYKEVLAPLGYKRIAFADPVKSCAMFFYHPIVVGLFAGRINIGDFKFQETFKEVANAHYEYFGETKSEKVRRQLQEIGTDIGRKIDPNIWVDIAIGYAENFPLAAFTDVRFPNEAEAIRKNGGKIIKIVRDTSILSKQAMQHPSETHIEEIRADFTISPESIESLRSLGSLVIEQASKE